LEWNRIERRAKEVETFKGEARIPAINEMRYAGRRIVDFLVATSSDDHEAARDHLIMAKAYLLNADHDLTDTTLFIVSERLNETERRYRYKRYKNTTLPMVNCRV
jgi:hypothetical protein